MTEIVSEHVQKILQNVKIFSMLAFLLGIYFSDRGKSFWSKKDSPWIFVFFN